MPDFHMEGTEQDAVEALVVFTVVVVETLATVVMISDMVAAMDTVVAIVDVVVGVVDVVADAVVDAGV